MSLIRILLLSAIWPTAIAIMVGLGYATQTFSQIMGGSESWYALWAFLTMLACDIMVVVGALYAAIYILFRLFDFD